MLVNFLNDLVAVVAQRHERTTVNMTVVGSNPFKGIKYLILLIPRFGKESKRGVEFRHSTRNTSIIRWKV